MFSLDPNRKWSTARAECRYSILCTSVDTAIPVVASERSEGGRSILVSRRTGGWNTTVHLFLFSCRRKRFCSINLRYHALRSKCWPDRLMAGESVYS